MNILKSPEFKVGLLVLAVIGLIGFMSMKVSEDPSYLSGSSQGYWFQVDDATGLVTNSVVKLAGVNVGVIKGITLTNLRARIDISLQGHLPVTTSSQVRIKALGFLGDKHVELVLGDTTAPRLARGSEIRNATDSGSMDVILDEVTKIFQALGDISVTLRDAASGSGTTDHPIGRIIRNVENLTSDLADVVGENKGALTDLVNNMSELSSRLNEVLGDDEERGFRAAWNGAIDSLKRIEGTLANFEEISQKVNDGEGTIGRLINDDSIVEEINTTVKGVNELLNAAKRIETSLDVHSEYLSDVGEAKSYFGLRIQPGLDRYYELAIVDDPKGVVETVDTTVTTGGNSTSTTTVTTFKNKTKFTALFAKNFYDFTLKGGLMESEGGVGVDYYLMNRRLRLSVETFDFSDLHLRTFARYDVWKGIYLIAGGDDLSDSANASGFFGAGLFLTNEDLKLLLARAPL